MGMQKCNINYSISRPGTEINPNHFLGIENQRNNFSLTNLQGLADFKPKKYLLHQIPWL